MNVKGDVLLDTHVWLWMALEDVRLSGAIRDQLAESFEERRLHLSAILLLEVATLYRKRQIELSVPLASWFRLSLDEAGLQVVPLSPEIAVASTQLPEDFHGDPADRLIAATAMMHDMTLCTRDHALVRFGRQGCYKLLEV